LNERAIFAEQTRHGSVVHYRLAVPAFERGKVRVRTASELTASGVDVERARRRFRQLSTGRRVNTST